jgi:hypothetical protein
MGKSKISIKSEQIIALSLRSILYLLKYPLKSWKSCQSELVNRLFSILADYAAMGQAANQPAIIELQQNLFKVKQITKRNGL